MSFNSTICDFICRMNQAIINKNSFASCRNTKLTRKILELFLEKKYINFYEEQGNKIIFSITFIENHSFVRQIKARSKPGRRLHVKFAELYKYTKIYSEALLSTNKGLQFYNSKTQSGNGGELLFLLDV